MGEHQLAETADEGEPDQSTGPGVRRRTSNVAETNTGHAHHQQRQQQQRQSQPEEAEMMGAQHPHAPGDQRHWHQDDGEPESLQEKVGNIGARHTHEIVRRAASGVVERRVARAVSEQRQQQYNTRRGDADPDQLHHAAAQEIAPAFRQDRRLAVHRGGDADQGHRALGSPYRAAARRVMPSRVVFSSCTSATRI